MATYYIADLHFGHENILTFDNRPFKTIEEHDKIIITNWTNVLGIDDDIYILGDISWYTATKTIEIFKGLNGIEHLIVGNHDKKLLETRELQSIFCEISDYKEIQLDNGKCIVLSLTIIR
jgi:calcineurin-like phosphoesterase family protein